MSDAKTIALIKALGGGGGGGGSSFNPTISNPQDGDTLVYNGTAGKWVNGAGGGAEMVIPSFTATVSPQSITCDKTFAEVYAAALQGLAPYALLTVTGMGSNTLQFHLINTTTQSFGFKYTGFGTIPGIIETRQYFEILLFVNLTQRTRNINISTEQSESPLIIVNENASDSD